MAVAFTLPGLDRFEDVELAHSCFALSYEPREQPHGPLEVIGRWFEGGREYTGGGAGGTANDRFRTVDWAAPGPRPDNALGPNHDPRGHRQDWWN